LEYTQQDIRSFYSSKQYCNFRNLWAIIGCSPFSHPSHPNPNPKESLPNRYSAL